ncbi:MAG TPA: lycopene cyclase domain-containing protein [Flavobacterium sp.]|jgi:lycopene cyclase domain-containing protein
MERYTYLLVDFFTVVVCFAFSFHPKIRFNQKFLPFIKGSFLVGATFIVWDAWFTNVGVWWFNDRYLLGVRFFGLPIEEILFFICIPFSCMFTYFCIDKFLRPVVGKKTENAIAGAFILLCLVIGLSNLDKLYTSVTFLSAAVVFAVLKYVLKVDWIGKVFLVYTILLIPFFIVNGILTGTGLEEAVVNYNPQEFLNIRILTVPIEDAFYGLELTALNLYFFKLFDRKQA